MNKEEQDFVYAEFFVERMREFWNDYQRGMLTMFELQSHILDMQETLYIILTSKESYENV